MGRPLGLPALKPMLRKDLLRVTAIIPALMVLPAVAAEPSQGPTAAGMPFPLAEVTLAEARAFAPIAQQSLPLPAEPQPVPLPKPEPAAAPQPDASPWAGTLEFYGFTPLRTTTSVTRGASQRDLPGLLGNRGGKGNLGRLAGIADGLGERLPDLAYPDQIEGLRGKLQQISLPIK